MWPLIVENYLRKHNYRQIGSGMYSSVYSRDGLSYAIKISNDFKYWPKYVLWATYHGYAGSFAPKVYRFVNFGSYFIAVMEKLDHCAGRSTLSALNSRSYYYRDFYHLYPGLKCFIHRLKYDGRRIGDLHSGNWMLNADETRLCLIDPQCDLQITVPRKWKHETVFTKYSHLFK